MRATIIRFFIGFLSILACNYSFAAPVITFGTLTFYPPFVYSNATGPYGGFDVDFAQALCNKMNVQCRFVSFPLESLLLNLQEHNVDAVISAINITSERKINFDFSIPYLRSSASYLVNPSNKNPPDLNNLKGKKIGAVSGSVFYSYLVQVYGNSISLKTYKEAQDAVYALSTGDIDVALLDTPVARYWQKNSQGSLAILGSPIGNQSFFGQGYGIAVNHGDYTLLRNLNAAIVAANADKSFQNLLNKYFAAGTFSNP